MKREAKLRSVVLLTALIGSLVASVVGCAQAPTPPAAKKVITVAVNADLTGPYGGICTYEAWGWRDWFEYVNKTKGGVKGVTYDVLILDTRHEPAKALTTYETAKAHGAKVVAFGDTGAIPLVEKRAAADGILAVGPGSSFSECYPARPNLIGITISHGRAYTIGMDYIKNVLWPKKGLTRVPKIAGLWWEHPSGRESYDFVKAYCEQLGWEYKNISFFASDAATFSPELSAAGAWGPDYLFVFAGDTHLNLIVKEGYAKGLWKKMTLLTNQFDAKYIPLLKVAGAEASEGILGVTMSGAQLSEEQFEGIRIVKAYNMERYGYLACDYSWGLYNMFWVGSMVVDDAIGRAIDKVGYEKLSGNDIMEAIEATKDFDTLGLAGKITMSKTIRNMINQQRVGTITGGAMKIITDYLSAPVVPALMK